MSDKHPSCIKYGHVYLSNCIDHYSTTCYECGELCWDRFIKNDVYGSGDWGGTRFSGYRSELCKDCKKPISGGNRRLPTEDNYNKCYEWSVKNKQGAVHIFYACFNSEIKDDGTVDLLLLDNSVFKNVNSFEKFRTAWIERLKYE